MVSRRLFEYYSPQKRRMCLDAYRAATTGHELQENIEHAPLEFCRHLDVTGLGLGSIPHTRGFFARIDLLDHRALGTPRDQRRELCWVRSGQGWYLDWSQSRAPAQISSTLRVRGRHVRPKQSFFSTDRLNSRAGKRPPCISKLVPFFPGIEPHATITGLSKTWHQRRLGLSIASLSKPVRFG